MSRPDAILIAGPTASGKSALALALAATHGGVVINADSMQVYRELRVLSARPSDDDMSRAPHRLYGHVPAAIRYSVGLWLVDAGEALAEAKRDRLVPIFVGGTGLYFKALTEGLASIPPIPPAIREALLADAEGVDTATLHRCLADRDPEAARDLRPSDRGRILRALEVVAATGRSLTSWRQGSGVPPLIDAGRATRIVLDPPRPWLHARIAERADHMVGMGGLEEALALDALGLSADMPAMKAIGVRQFLDERDGKLTLTEAIASLKTETRRYAKRQMTWFRNQMADWPRHDPT